MHTKGAARLPRATSSRLRNPLHRAERAAECCCHANSKHLRFTMPKDSTLKALGRNGSPAESLRGRQAPAPDADAHRIGETFQQRMLFSDHAAR